MNQPILNHLPKNSLKDIPKDFPKFLCLPKEQCDPKTAMYQILPVPYEGTVCFLDGTAKGPAAILAVSDQMEHFDEELLIDFTQCGIAVLPPIPPADTPEEEFERIYSTVKQYDFFRAKRFPILLGGEHSITPPMVRAASEFCENLSVLQFDAHADLRESYTGGRYSHASAMRRVLDWTPHLVQVGIRSFSEEEYRDHPERIHRILTPKMLAEDPNDCFERILYCLTEHVYITIDIDVFDPALAPGTGTPEPGGLDWRQVTGLLRKVCAAKNVIGADLVETAPLGGHNVVTEFLAARLVSKIIAYTQDKSSY
ncbi:MAG: agmatinase [Planctomycetaceae bacterium]|jgi:agmatinase|nr:agmatinase [Planctomycetaceae bacterium]